MRAQGVEEAEQIRVAREASQANSGVQAQTTNTRALSQTEGRVTLGSRADRQSSVGVAGDLFIEDETKWVYVYDTAWKYIAGAYVGTYAQLTALVLDSTDEGALFVVTNVGVNHGLWVAQSGAFVRQLLPDSPDALTEYRINGQKVVGARGGAIANPAGGVTIDVEARTAIVAILTQMRADGKIS